jgi:hypothetical protein
MFGLEPSPLHRGNDPQTSRPVDLDAHAAPAPGMETKAETDRGTRKAALWMSGAMGIAVVAIVAVVFSSTAGDPVTAQPAAGPVAPVAVQAATSSAPPAPEQDRAIAYTASANCPPGSTSAQSLTGAGRDATWTCVRGQQGARVDGQVLHVDLGGSYVLSAVSVTPGWVAKDPGGADEWLQHRVVTRLQYVFDDADRTIFTQDTGNAHGPVTTALPTRVLASRVTVIVLQTSRPPASPQPSKDPTTPARPAFGDSLLGPFGAPPSPDGTALADPAPPDDSGDDPVDATFAISALTFLGHRPM